MKATKRIAALTGAAALGATLLVSVPQSAGAATKSVGCNRSAGSLSTWWHYTKPSRSTVKVGKQLNYKVWNNSRAHNNVYFALRSNGGDTNHWAWTSDDNIKGGVPYYGSIGRIYTIPISHRPYVKVHATFDVPGRDPSCTAYGHIGW
ncbi:hypothetical protein ACWDBO_48990 [Streptomyces mirabilis]|uniref:hypothetical protein n=1 Tax=Streptomyces TaxID=1883 RepID=UPI0029A8DB55|nr:hypothetical protein [Streptomyces sp. AK02-04a]MDX3763291.1 hypothetical protein [Streptomyces sp. AK02-04a]